MYCLFLLSLFSESSADINVNNLNAPTSEEHGKNVFNFFWRQIFFIYTIVFSDSGDVNRNLTHKKAINRDCFFRFRSDKKEYIRCQICTKYPETVKLHVYNKKIPAIATENGTLYRSDVLEKHISTDYHAACERVEMIKSLNSTNENLGPMDVSIRKSVASQANHVGKIMIQVFADAKIMTTAAYNWPVRYVANEASNAFEFNDLGRNTIPQNIPLNYVNPKQHLNMLKHIVEADRENIKTLIEECLAISLRVDGSIDRSQKDKIYVM